jgi:hypothetical protein
VDCRRNGRAARQPSHLTVLASGLARRAVLAVLALDGVLSAILGAFFLPFYVGSVPLPVSGLLSGLTNAALVWAASHWTSSTRIAALPLWTWLATVAALMLGGPGGDVVLSGAGVMQMAPIILILLGAAPPVYVLRRLTSKVGS